jgi:hypothetical protein
MKLEHLIITRFAVRMQDALRCVGGPTFFADRDPLARDNLALRSRLLDFTSLPSVRAQTDPDVAWVLLVDRDLPASYRGRLEARVRQVRRGHLHVYDPGDDMGGLAWCRPYLRRGTTHVLTTTLDDDDVLPAATAAGFRHHAEGLARAGRLPPAMIMAFTEVVQWDLLPSPTAPLGYRSPWHRGRFPASCGFSLLAAVEEDASVMALRHRFGAAFFDPDAPVTNENVAFARARFAHVLAAWPKEALFWDATAALGPVLMCNHFVNDQETRLSETKAHRARVRRPEDLPFPIDWAAYARNAWRFSSWHPDAVAKGARGLGRRVQARLRRLRP